MFSLTTNNSHDHPPLPPLPIDLRRADRISGLSKINSMKNNDNLQTPEYVYSALGPIDLDPCAGEETTIGYTNWWIGRGENGLKREWHGFVFCNPPFSEKEIWIKKMIWHGNGILLLPERGSAPWFGPLAEKSDGYFVMGKKINFIGGPSSNNLGSALFCFGNVAVHRIKYSGLCGHFNKVQYFTPRSEK